MLTIQCLMLSKPKHPHCSNLSVHSVVNFVTEMLNDANQEPNECAKIANFTSFLSFVVNFCIQIQFFVHFVLIKFGDKKKVRIFAVLFGSIAQLV